MISSVIVLGPTPYNRNHLRVFRIQASETGWSAETMAGRCASVDAPAESTCAILGLAAVAQGRPLAYLPSL